MKATTTNFGAAAATTQSPNATNALKSNERYGLSTVSSRPKSKLRSRAGSLEKRVVSMHEGPVDIQQMYTSEAFGNGGTITQCERNVRADQQSMESFGSEQIIIRKAVDVTVE